MITQTAAASVVATTLEEFLDRSGGDHSAERIQRIGLAMGAGGILLATGVIALVVLVPLDRGDRDVLVQAVVLGGIIASFGAIVEVFGIANLLELGWWDAFRDESGAAPMMRLLGALLIVLGVIASQRVPLFAIGGVAVGLLSFAFDGHTNSEGPRVVHALVDLAHVGAAGVWFGGVVALAILARRGSLVGDRAVLGLRFASLATAALVVVTLAGIVMAAFILDDIGDLWGTTWGRMLLLKTVLVAAVAALGGYHHLAITDHGGRRRIAGTLVAEAALFVTVIAVTAVLVTSSPG